jgi:hypothetical protein
MKLSKCLKATLLFLCFTIIDQAFSSDIENQQNTHNFSNFVDVLPSSESVAFYAQHLVKATIPAAIGFGLVIWGALLIKQDEIMTDHNYIHEWYTCGKTSSGYGNRCERAQVSMVCGSILLTFGFFSLCGAVMVAAGADLRDYAACMSCIIQICAGARS